MKNKFLSKAVPRGTRTIWRYLGALFILFTFAIGQMWAGTESISWGITTNAFTLSPTITPATGAHLSNASTSISLTGLSNTSSSKSGYSKPFYGSTEAFNDSKYASISFVVADGYTFTPSSLDMTVFSYGTGNLKYRVIISDSKSHSITSEDIKPASGGEAAISFSSLNTKLEGTVTIKLFLFNYNNTSSGKRTYIKSPIAISGSVEEAGGGETGVCPSGISITGEDEYLEGETISLTANKTAGNGEITYTWYKGADLATAKAAGALGTGATYTKSNCVTGDAGKYFCEATKTSCSGAASSGFDVTVAADTKCFNMPAITSKPADLASVVVTGGTLSDVSTAKSVAMNANGLKLDGNSVYLKVTLADASIIAGTKITVAWKGAGSGAGIAVVNGDLAEKVIDETNVEAAGSATHTFTAAEAANYADEFIIHRNASGTGIYVNAITVEDCGPAVTKHTVTLNYNDGATPDGSLKVVDGNAAVKPTDPTRGKYTFLGWFVGDTDTEYVWSTAVTGDITLKAHWQDPWTITFDANGGSAVADVTVKHNTKAEKPADPTKDDYDFMGWYYGSPAVAFDWDANVKQDYALVAHWESAVAKYDVEYYDGDTKIGTEPQVWANQHPTAAGIETSKPLYTFVGWFTSSTLEGDPVDLNTVTPVEGLKIYGKWAKAYAQSIDMEQFVLDNGKAGNWHAYLDSKGYAYASSNMSLDSLNGDKTKNNYQYLGLKFNKNSENTYVEGNLAAGKLMVVKVGAIGNNTYMKIDGAKVTEPAIVGGVEADSAAAYTYWYYDTDKTFSLFHENGGTSMLKGITITDPYQVSFNPNGGDPVASQDGTPSVILPDASNGTSSLLGWFDAAEGGNKIGDVGDSYTPTADIELFAHWEAVSTDARLASITFSATGTLSPAFDPEVTSYTYTMPYGTAAIPTITGATSVNAKAQDPIIGEAAAAWGEAQTVKGVAQSGDKKTYTITMAKAPKDGVSIIKATINSTTKNTIGEVTGLYKKDASCGGLSSYKFNGKGAYIGIELVAGQTFNEGDIINIHTTTAAEQGTIALYNDHGNTVSAFHDYGVMGGAGDNKFALPASAEEKSLIYVCRTEANTWNGFVDYIEVTRAMNPMLTAMTIDGRTVTINEAAKTATVTIPYEADLAALTVVPTIVWNEAAATNSIVVNDGSAWVLGPNTYKLTDKDGDYTVYTITLTRDVLKHTVSFNTHGGSAVASVEVEDGAQLAAAPAAPEKEDYIFQGWAETADGAVVDVTSFTISAAKEFHAIWASDGAIKLITGTTVNTSDFITGLSVEDDEIGGVKLAGGVSDVNGVKDLTRVIAYNAKSNQTKIQIKAYNTNSSNRTFVVKGLVEGASEAVELASITLGNKETKTTEWIEFNNADVKNRTIYIFSSSSASDIRFLQVKVIDDGETATKVAGEVGYSLSFDHGRFFGLKATTAQFEGMSVDIASSDCQPLSSSVVKVKEASMSFTAAAPVLLKVTTANNKTYYVANSTSGTTNETAKTGESEFNLAAGTWFINAGASEVQFTNIAFELPKAEKPVVADLANVDYCQGSAIDELAVSATVSDGGTKLYQWYKDGVKIDGAEAATYQPTADGEYYVVVVNTKADHQNSDPTQSNTIIVTGHAGTAISGTTGAENWPGTDVTISVEASGKNLSYAWYTCSDAMGTNPVAVDPAVNAAELNVTVGAADTYYKVVVSGDCGDAQEAIITVIARQAVDLQDVTGNMKWDFSKANDGSAATDNLCNDEVLANVHGIVNNSDFTSDNIKATAKKFKNGKLQASMIKFHTTVDGMITVVFSNTGSKSQDRYLTVNGRKTDKGSKTETAVTYTGFVYAGDVELGVVEGDGNMLNFTSVDFKATVDYPRPVNPNNIGTLCWTNDAVLGGATLYELAGKDANSKLVFDEVPENRLVAGKPYVFVPENGNTVIKVYNTTDDEPLTAPLDANKEMQGTFVDMTTVGTTEGDGDLWYKYIISNNHYIYVDYQNCNLGAYRAYFHSIDAIPAASEEPQQGSNGAPRRRLVVGGNNVPAVTTGVDNLNVGDQPIKVMIDGQMYILRGDKMYDATGRLVK
jgi:uncharacterized repeat protein (TIGR02543 family)